MTTIVIKYVHRLVLEVCMLYLVTTVLKSYPVETYAGIWLPPAGRCRCPPPPFSRARPSRLPPATGRRHTALPPSCRALVITFNQTSSVGVHFGIHYCWLMLASGRWGMAVASATSPGPQCRTRSIDSRSPPRLLARLWSTRRLSPNLVVGHYDTAVASARSDAARTALIVYNWIALQLHIGMSS